MLNSKPTILIYEPRTDISQQEKSYWVAFKMAAQLYGARVHDVDSNDLTVSALKARLQTDSFANEKPSIFGLSTDNLFGVVGVSLTSQNYLKNTSVKSLANLFKARVPLFAICDDETSLSRHNDMPVALELDAMAGSYKAAVETMRGKQLHSFLMGCLRANAVMHVVAEKNDAAIARTMEPVPPQTPVNSKEQDHRIVKTYVPVIVPNCP